MMMNRAKQRRPDEVLYRFPHTSRAGVTCLSFGKDRKARYPVYFFCHGCDIFEDVILNWNKRAKRTPDNKHACTGGHQADGGCPTTLRKAFWPIEGDSDKNEEDEVKPTTEKKRAATTKIARSNSFSSSERKSGQEENNANKSPCSYYQEW
jgi:hypothetical protein